ncbi:hypothetical protein A9993_22080 [Rahnella victoriana]|uniref:hypothetical protein n=1 Tax=Rahnella victoriana TaxID=1510570 RepID=UPI000BB1ACE1|nr:hypothetical protein [Rahnella victoriana]PBI82246.1 hypothetical protein A9993_22080 [Rahnella victoriana]
MPIPTADALEKLAIVLHVTSDFLLFQPGEREPEDDVKLRFEALAARAVEDQEMAKAVLDAVIVKSQITQNVARVSKATAKVKD